MAGAPAARTRHAPGMTRPRPATILAGLALALSACAGGAGSASPAPATETLMASDFRLTSTAFDQRGEIPRRFSCDGENISPDLAWSGVPSGAGALVLVVDDPDAGGFAHWLVLDLTASDSGALPLGVSASPDAPPQGTNDFGSLGWAGPCPPSGEHRYVFTLHALAAPLGLTGAPRRGEVRAALGKATVLGTAVIEARYRRQR